MRAVGTKIAVAAVAVGGALVASAAYGNVDVFAATTPTLTTLTYTAPAGSAGGLDNPFGVAAGGGTAYISNTEDNVVATVAGGKTSIIAGSYENYGEAGDGGPATSATVYQPAGLALDSKGDLFVADSGDNVVREITPDGTIHLFAGNGTAGNTGNGGPATSAELDDPQAVAVDAAGDVFIADTDSNEVREVTPAGTITDFAGTGTAGFSGDGGPAASAELNQPSGVAVDSEGNVYIADASNNVIREVAANGTISTVAGDYAADQANDGLGGFSGDGGPATAAQLHDPQGVAVDGAGDIFIADTYNNAIREVTPNGIIETVVNTAGTNGAAPGAGGESSGKVATASKLSGPYAVAVDNSTDTLYIADTGNSKLASVSGLVSSAAPTTVVPEAPLAVAMPLVGAGLIGGLLGIRRRRAARRNA